MRTRYKWLFVFALNLSLVSCTNPDFIQACGFKMNQWEKDISQAQSRISQRKLSQKELSKPGRSPASIMDAQRMNPQRSYSEGERAVIESELSQNERWMPLQERVAWRAWAERYMNNTEKAWDEIRQDPRLRSHKKIISDLSTQFVILQGYIDSGDAMRMSAVIDQIGLLTQQAHQELCPAPQF